MTAGVYYIYCLASDGFYIGSSVNVESRFNDHKKHLRWGDHDNQHLQRAWNKYGEDAFIFKLLHAVEDPKWVVIYEQIAMNTLKPTYNMKQIAYSNYGVKYSAEICERMSKIRLGKRCGEKNTFYGKKHTDETKKKIGDANRGRPAWSKGKHTDPMTCSKRKLDWDDVREIRAEWKKEVHKSVKELSQEFNVTTTQIWAILHGKCWKENNDV